jgi:hypothetical protein
MYMGSKYATSPQIHISSLEDRILGYLSNKRPTIWTNVFHRLWRIRQTIVRVTLWTNQSERIMLITLKKPIPHGTSR